MVEDSGGNLSRLRLEVHEGQAQKKRVGPNSYRELLQTYEEVFSESELMHTYVVFSPKREIDYPIVT